MTAYPEHREVYVDEVIISRQARRGDGKQTPIRAITQVFTKQGELLAEHDPQPDVSLTVPLHDLTEFLYQNLTAFSEDPHRLVSDWVKMISKPTKKNDTTTR